ncbi:Uncharacterized membrane protein YczE [Saccharopolyspora kobensis]|uniref:Uncharacterized membrane protein YczE n=1 Tax=Saccharopolyspora kobensis TaxID=146035 RepID=A0A1H6DZJ4_9PSEU|nr:hypothetical protein [Saccharopolyspora kobensis]SEG90253.1 Uncharacterized membrane protein YczE [Saccharopolyspora kobensis]SFD89907.1 Uncharacterized membrane protein YczE [Saccharopolyspora kobensis]
MASETLQVDLSTLPLRTRPVFRLAQLFAGLAAYGISMGFMVRAQLGLDPWDVLHQGLAERLGWSFGAVTALTGVLVLLAWLPLRQRPGIGTVANVVVIAVAVDLTLALTPQLSALPGRIALMVSAIVLNGIATAVYVGARLGPGPRDGLMTGLHARTGWSIRVVRTTIELCVLAAGWVLGGTVGVGTLLYAAAIGPLTQFFIRFTTVREKKDLCP